MEVKTRTTHGCQSSTLVGALQAFKITTFMDTRPYPLDRTASLSL